MVAATEACEAVRFWSCFKDRIEALPVHHMRKVHQGEKPRLAGLEWREEIDQVQGGETKKLFGHVKLGIEPGARGRG